MMAAGHAGADGVADYVKLDSDSKGASGSERLAQPGSPGPPQHHQAVGRRRRASPEGIPAARSVVLLVAGDNLC